MDLPLEHRGAAWGRRRRALRRAIPLLVAVGLAACGHARGGGDVLLVTVDTLRADHLGLYGYERPTSPHIDALFADAAIFDRAYSTTAYTSASTASLLSGELPQEHGVRLFNQIFPDRVVLLPQLLPDRYQTAAFVSTRILSNDGTGMASRFDHFDDTIERRPDVGLRERAAGPTTDAVLRWLDDGSDPDRPLFLWVHYKDPHRPYHPPADAPRHFRHEAAPVDPASIPAPYRKEGMTDPLDYVDDYDDEIAYADAAIGRLIEGFAKRRDLDRTLLILTADHGETLLERERWFGHAYQVYDEIVHVPLLVRGPGVAPGRYAGLSSGIDVAPTILRFAGAPVPAGLAGADLRHGAALDPDRTVFVESAHTLLGHQWRSAIRGKSKWVVKVRPDGIRDRYEYDLGRDPQERKPIPWRDDAASRALLDLVKSDPDPSAVPASPEFGTLPGDLLRKLGYAQ